MKNVRIFLKKSLLALLPIVLFACSRESVAQSLFTTGKGDSSVGIGNGSFIRANFGDNSLQLGFQKDPNYTLNGGKQLPSGKGIAIPVDRHLRLFPRYGFQLEAKPKSGTGTLLTGDTFSVNGRVTASYGLSRILSYTRSIKDIKQDGEKIEILEKGAKGIYEDIKKADENIEKLKKKYSELPKDIVKLKNDIDKKKSALSNPNTIQKDKERIQLEISLLEKQLKDTETQLAEFPKSIEGAINEISERVSRAEAAKRKGYLLSLSENENEVDALNQKITLLKEDLSKLKIGSDEYKNIANKIEELSTQYKSDKSALKERQSLLNNALNPPNGPRGIGYDWANLSISYSKASYDLLTPTAGTTLKDQFTPKNYDGLSLVSSYNAFFDRGRTPIIVLVK